MQKNKKKKTIIYYGKINRFHAQLRIQHLWITQIIKHFLFSFVFRLINGIIEYDRKHRTFSSELLLYKRSPSKTCWIIILLSFFIYFIGYEICVYFLWPPKSLNINVIPIYIFSMPNLIDFAILIFVCFFLSNIGFRFLALNNFWRCLPVELVPVSGKWSHSEIVILIENIRLLHAELSEILKIFNLGYGPMLLGYFVSSFIDLMYVFYLMLYHEFKIPNRSLTEKVIKYLPLHIFNIQIIVFMIFVFVAASWIHDMVQKIFLIL